jgi:hypothetical protein
MQCKEWDDANSELFKESHDEAVHKNPRIKADSMI